jgi:hypothetical protein
MRANNPNAESVARDARKSARSLGLQFHVLNAGTDQDIDTIFAGLIQQRIAYSSSVPPLPQVAQPGNATVNLV